MKRNLLIFCACLALVLCCSACFGASGKQVAKGNPDIALEFPEGAPGDAEVHTAGGGIKVIRPEERKETTSASTAPVTPETVWQGEDATGSQ